MVDTDFGYIKYNGEKVCLCRLKVLMLSEILLACKDLIADAKISCADLVFKDICLDVLSKARLVLEDEQFNKLKDYVNENLQETDARPGRKIRIR
jgi:hypothetical protein